MFFFIIFLFFSFIGLNLFLINDINEKEGDAALLYYITALQFFWSLLLNSLILKLFLQQYYNAVQVIHIVGHAVAAWESASLPSLLGLVVLL